MGQTRKNVSQYSDKLNKVFIDMQNVLQVDVRRNATSAELYLRITLLYSLPQFAQGLLKRCSTYMNRHLMANRDADPMIIKQVQVLRCTNSGSVYMGNTET